MKNKLIIFLSILLVSIMVGGGTSAWFTSSPDPKTNEFNLSIVNVEVEDKGLDDIRLKNLGSSDAYVRVILIPMWSDPSISTRDVNIKIGDDWKEKDGYYYYKKVLGSGEKTSNLIDTISIPQERGESFTLKVVAEGVQSSHMAWKDVWSIDNLPF